MRYSAVPDVHGIKKEVGSAASEQVDNVDVFRFRGGGKGKTLVWINPKVEMNTMVLLARRAAWLVSPEKVPLML